jgi:hypothetical protein
MPIRPVDHRRNGKNGSFEMFDVLFFNSHLRRFRHRLASSASGLCPPIEAWRQDGLTYHETQTFDSRPAAGAWISNEELPRIRWTLGSPERPSLDTSHEYRAAFARFETRRRIIERAPRHDKAEHFGLFDPFARTCARSPCARLS